MKIQRWDQLTSEEKSKILESPGGLDRVLKLHEDTLIQLKNQVKEVANQIKDKEETAVSWMNLLVILALLQVIGLDKDYSKIYLIASLPSFMMAFLTTAYTLLKHPNYLKTDFFVPEKEDKQTRYAMCEAEINMLQDIYKRLNDNYNRKKKYAGFIGPAIIANFLVSVIIIICIKIFGFEMSIFYAIVLMVLSLLFILILQKHLTKSVSHMFNKK